MGIIKIYTYSSFGCISLWKTRKTTAAHYADINLKNNCSLNPVPSSPREADSGPAHERHASFMALRPAEMAQVQRAATALPTGKWGAGFCLHLRQTAAVSTQAYKNFQPSRLCSDPSNWQTCWMLARSGKIWVFGNSANGAALTGNSSGCLMLHYRFGRSCPWAGGSQATQTRVQGPFRRRFASLWDDSPTKRQWNTTVLKNSHQLCEKANIEQKT